MQLADVSEYVQPCFPPDYRVFDLVIAEYVGHLRGVVDCIGACAGSMANEDILQVARWARGTGHALDALGVAPDLARFDGEYACVCVWGGGGSRSAARGGAGERARRARPWVCPRQQHTKRPGRHKPPSMQTLRGPGWVC